ncbi:MAG: DUF447 domain-containing protein [Pirellulales bacterium]
MPMILESIITTTNADGSVNISPMGPEVDETWQRFTLKPFQSSKTYANLKRTGRGVLHVTDDVELLAQAAVGQPNPLPPMTKAAALDGWILADACRWYAFRVELLDDSQPRTRIEVAVTDSGRQRDFFGFNRAKHAVVEAAILATRLHLLPAEQIAAEFERLAVLIDKTGGEQERRAFDFLRRHVREQGPAA